MSVSVNNLHTSYFFLKYRGLFGPYLILKFLKLSCWRLMFLMPGHGFESKGKDTFLQIQILNLNVCMHDTAIYKLEVNYTLE